MAVYYKFKSAKDYDTVPIDGHFISVGSLKEKIFESKHLGRGTDFDLVITNAQTNEEYPDESALIPKNTAVLIRRVPGRPRMPIVATVLTEEKPKLDNSLEDVQTVKSSFAGLDSSAVKFSEDTEWDEFGNDLYSIPDVLPVQSSKPVEDATPPSKADEENKIKALIDTPALDWQRQLADGFAPARGFVRNGRMVNNRNFVRGGYELKTPPPGYVCHRCKVPGHFIQHCPTNGDPNFDIKKVKPPTGIPRSMLMATPDGSYALPSGAAAVLKPNEAAFEKEIEGMPSSTRPVGDLPPELRCPLCKEVMKDAVLTSKCCFTSFCDKCIRDYIISKSMCICGATNILADDLLPNKTLRDTINRILESNTDSAENGGSAYQVQDLESRNPQAKVPSPTQSAASKGWQEPLPPPHREETSKLQEITEEGKDVSAPNQATEKEITTKVANTPEVMHESLSVKEPTSEGSAPLADDEVQQRPASGEAGKKKKKKKTRLPLNAADMHWRMTQDLAADNYMMSMGPSAYNPYWGMQPGMEGFVAPYPGAMPYMGYGVGPMDLPFGGVLPPDPFGGQGCMMPFGPPPSRDPFNFGMGFNPAPPGPLGPPPMSREEFEAHKADLKRRRELERRAGERDLSKGGEFGREVGRSGDVSSMKPKTRPSPIPPTSSSDRHYRDRHRSERPSPDRRSRDPELPHPSMKRRSGYDEYHQHRDHYDDHRRRDHHDDRRRGSEDDDHQHRPESSAAGKSSSVVPEVTASPQKVTSVTEKKQKSSVFSRIRFPEGEAAASKKRKQSSSVAEASASASGSHKGSSNAYYEDRPKASTKKSATVAVDYESSDDDRHFKRRPSRYEASPPPVSAERKEQQQPRHSRGLKERDRYPSKHRS